MTADRVVVTGLGAVTPWGWGVEPLFRGLRSGRTSLGRLAGRRFPVEGFRTDVGGEVPPAGGDDAPSAPDGDDLSWADRFALAAAREAAVDAGWVGVELEGAFPTGPGRVGVYFASSTGGMVEAEEYYAGLVGTDPRRSLRTLVSQEYQGPGDAVARALGVRGPVETCSSACSSATLALGSALDALRDGEVDVALVGGSDVLCRLTYSGFNALRAVDPEPCRPFRADRAGMSMGEGAAVLVLEREEVARRRSARPRAVVLGAGASCDAFHTTAPEADGTGPAAALTAALADAGVGPDAVAFVDAHGTGTRHNDTAEVAALERVFGARVRGPAEPRLLVTSTKGSVGHLLASAGAVEAVAVVVALETGEVHPTPGPDAVDPELGVDLVTRRARCLDVPPGERIGVSLNLAFGGANAAVVLAGVEP